jgi:hypothetical protein
MIHENISAPEPSFEPSRTREQQLDWRCAHEELSEIAKTRARLDWREGKALLFAVRAGAHVMLGFATFAEYIERLFGYRPRWTSERLRVAEALEVLPEVDQALRDGAVSWSAVREVTRVAVPENEHGSRSQERERSDNSKSWCRDTSSATGQVTGPMRPHGITSSDSRSRLRHSRRFGRRWGRFAGTQADLSMRMRRCF